jgi:hypothetical protein
MSQLMGQYADARNEVVRRCGAVNGCDVNALLKLFAPRPALAAYAAKTAQIRYERCEWHG